jgi:hypothetical protein
MVNSLIVTSSLAETTDRINDALFFGRIISATEKKEVALWIAERQGGPNSYRGMFSPTKQDVEDGFRLFTGERVTSGAQVSHILGEESLRALALLNVKSATVDLARNKAASGFAHALDEYSEFGKSEGWFCCGTCTPAYWRNLAAGGLDEVIGGKTKAEERLALGIKVLEAHRDRKGKWQRFPFYFTLLALIDFPQLAKSELKYVAPECEKLLARKVSKQADEYSIRRREVLMRSLVV